MNQGLDYFMSLKFKEEYTKDGNEYVGKIPRLRGCIVRASSLEECKRLLYNSKAAWLSEAVEAGNFIPLPEDN